MEILSRGFAWLDTGTHESLMEATEFIKALENRTGLKIACLEEIALKNSWVQPDFVKQFAEQSASSSLGQYLLRIVEK